MSRTRRSLLTYVSSIGFVFVTGVVGIAVTPVLLRLIGPAALGGSRALTEWFTLIGLVELGLTTAVQGEMARTGGDRDREAAVLRAGLAAFTRVGAVILGLGVGFAAVAPWAVRMDEGAVWDLRLAALVTSAGAVLYPANALRALLDARGRGYWLQLVAMAQSLVLAGLCVALGRVWPSVTGQALASVLAIGLLTVPLVLACRVELGLAAAADPGATAAVAGQLRNTRLPAAVWGLCSRVQLVGVLLLAATADAAAGLDVSITQRLLYAVGTAVLTIGAATWAGVSQAHHERAGGGVGPLVQVSRASAALAGLVFPPLVAVNPPFVRWWVGGGHDLGPGYAAGTAAGLFLYSLLNAWALPLVGVGALRPVAWAFGLSTAAAVAGCWLAVQQRAYTAAVLAVAAAPLVVLVYPVPNLLAAHLGVSRRRLLAAVARPLLLAAAPVAGLTVLSATTPDTLPVRAGLAAGYCVLFCGLLFAVELDPAERGRLVGLLPFPFLRRRR